MRLNLLTIENIGPFKGRHSIDFSTEDLDKPIVLIGALNGSGKTTVLEAIQIALYGPFSQPAKASSKVILVLYKAYSIEMLQRDIRLLN